ncbi:ermin isoform X1 [Hyperolius riggenbachi]|uniref:ermin isoform X1 n=1 Tax=Hyperolius riggenbachi TaxID=752182 RepID=UPI0035A2B84D
MEEEAQVPECNGDTHPEMTPVTNIIDQMDTSVVCETWEGDPVSATKMKEGLDSHLADKSDLVLKICEENFEEVAGQQEAKDATAVKESDMLTIHPRDSDDHNTTQDCQTRLEAGSDSGQAHDSPGPDEFVKQEKGEEENTTDPEDTLTYERCKDLTESREDTETEEENTSIETDNSSNDEQDNGLQQVLSVSNLEQPLSENISRHSYSRYNTVSYRKIRKGNTKQRIDEFESMMN